MNSPISPSEIYDLTPAEIFEVMKEIVRKEKNDFSFEKDKLEAIVNAVTLGIANTRKRGKPYRLFASEKENKQITEEQKRKDLEYLKKRGGF